MSARTQDDHERINAQEYPGTRQLCFQCGEPTGRCEEDSMMDDSGDGPYCETCWGEGVCGFCGKAGADKFPHPEHWPGEQIAGTEFVHAACEDEECRRAHALLSDNQRRAFLRSI